MDTPPTQVITTRRLHRFSIEVQYAYYSVRFFINRLLRSNVNPWIQKNYPGSASWRLGVQGDTVFKVVPWDQNSAFASDLHIPKLNSLKELAARPCEGVSIWIRREYVTPLLVTAIHNRIGNGLLLCPSVAVHTRPKREFLYIPIIINNEESGLNLLDLLGVSHDEIVLESKDNHGHQPDFGMQPSVFGAVPDSPIGACNTSSLNELRAAIDDLTNRCQRDNPKTKR